MKEEEYCEVWSWMANMRKLERNVITTSQRRMPMWEELQAICNDLLRSISVEGREGRISIALDDDKIHLQLDKTHFCDMFNLKYTTHVKANRKGLIGHTAVSTGANIPLQIVFERVNSTTLSCFKQCLDGLFGQDGNANLRNVSVHSDRGYMLPNLVFKYLIENGAEVVGTVKRMAQCWPFTYHQKLKEGDKRTLVEVKGAPTLLLKWCYAGAKAIFASAFWNGTERVATAISTLHKGQAWEGVVMKTSEKKLYDSNKEALIPKFFCKVKGIFCKSLPEGSAQNDPVQLKLEELLQDKIEPLTLRQGEFSFPNISINYSISISQFMTSFFIQEQQIGTTSVNLA